MPILATNAIEDAFSPLIKQEASTALADLDNLPNLRLAATQSNLPALVVVQKYATIVSDLLVLEQNTAQGVSDASLSQTVRVLDEPRRTPSAVRKSLA